MRALLMALLTAWAVPSHAADDDVDALRRQVERIDAETPGNLGVYVKRLADGARLEHGAARGWYLASTVKLVVAIAVLREVEAGRLALQRRLVLQDIDRIDGSGALVWQAAGTRHEVGALLRRMLMDSDNTAANLLIRTLGAAAFDRHARELLGADLTDFTRVRRDVYAELHPASARLTNRQLVEVAAAPLGPRRVDALRRMLKLEPAQLKAKTIEQAYAAYYARGLNTAPLAAYGAMLERLVRGELLAPAHTALLFKLLKYDTYDAYRLEAGLPRSVRFIHKTGTQLRTACHMGVIEPQDGGRRAIVVSVCAEGLDPHGGAGRAFERVGRAIAATLLEGDAQVTNR